MATETSNANESAVTAAVEFVAAQRGGPKRILEKHYPMTSGTCAGCGVVPIRYPCTAARIAELAKQHRRGQS